MFCTNCGNNIPDGSPFCPECGSSQDVAATPQAAPKNTSVAIPKFELPAMGSPKMIRLALSALCVLLLIISYFSTLGRSIEKIPMFSILGAMNMAEAREEMAQSHELAEERFDAVEEDLTTKEKKAIKKVLDSMEDVSKRISITNIKKLVKNAKAVAKISYAEVDNDYFDFDDEMQEFDSITTVLNIISTAVLIGMLLCLIFTGVGGFLGRKGFVIAGLVLCIPYGLIFSGLLFMLAFIGLNIATFIFIGKEKTAAAV